MFAMRRITVKYCGFYGDSDDVISIIMVEYKYILVSSGGCGWELARLD